MNANTPPPITAKILQKYNHISTIAMDKKMLPLARAIATLGGVGFIKPASGTWGTLASMPLAYLIATYLSNFSLIIFSALFFLIGWWAISVYEKHTDKHDASEVVIDELCGVFITLSIAPVSVYYYALAFLLFRIFDITKPTPIHLIDNEKTPFSVMFDDVIAGAYAGFVLWFILFLNF